MTSDVATIPDTEQTRDRLAAAVREAAPLWDAWVTARDAVDAAWRALYTTPAPLFPGAVLALFDRHDEAQGAATAWDEHAIVLLVRTLRDEDGHITTWADMADIMGQDTTGWHVEDISAYRTLYESRPLSRQAAQTRHSHQARLERLDRLVPGALEVER